MCCTSVEVPGLFHLQASAVTRGASMQLSLCQDSFRWTPPEEETNGDLSASGYLPACLSGQLLCGVNHRDSYFCETGRTGTRCFNHKPLETRRCCAMSPPPSPRWAGITEGSQEVIWSKPCSGLKPQLRAALLEIHSDKTPLVCKLLFQ